jgi:hypothetical protein
MNRECKDCKVNLPITNFGYTSKSKKYHRRVCEKCIYIKRKAYQKKYYKEHYVSKRKPKVPDAPAEQAE